MRASTTLFIDKFDVDVCFDCALLLAQVELRQALLQVVAPHHAERPLVAEVRQRAAQLPHALQRDRFALLPLPAGQPQLSTPSCLHVRKRGSVLTVQGRAGSPRRTGRG